MKVIIGFIDEAAGWLGEIGTDQWSTPWPDANRRDQRVKRGIVQGCTWMVVDGHDTVATITCRPNGNRHLWTLGELGQRAVYVSRLIVQRSHAGQDIGHELFDWAGRWAAEQYGARWIRIDVWTTNRALHNYYEKRGFEPVRSTFDPGYPSAALFQKPTVAIADADIPRLRDVPLLRRPDPDFYWQIEV
jgi:GNAT superfamily N-acetyltransferase